MKNLKSQLAHEIELKQAHIRLLDYYENSLDHVKNRHLGYQLFKFKKIDSMMYGQDKKYMDDLSHSFVVPYRLSNGIKVYENGNFSQRCQDGELFLVVGMVELPEPNYDCPRFNHTCDMISELTGGLITRMSLFSSNGIDRVCLHNALVVELKTKDINVSGLKSVVERVKEFIPDFKLDIKVEQIQALEF